MEKKKTKSKIGSIISTIIYIVLMVLLLFVIIMNFNKKDNQISNFFGYSFAVVQSGSMIDGGFNVGDMVVVKTVNTDTLKKTDIIVFYDYKDPVDNTINAPHLIDTDTYEDVERTDGSLNRHTKQDAINQGKRLIFHRIINVYVDDYGVRFYETKGDSNNSADSNFVREDFVCAKYVEVSPFVQSTFQFITSSWGLVVVIILPVILTVVLEVISVGGEIKRSRIAEKLLARKVKYNEIDKDKVKLSELLTDYEKVYLYDISSPEDKLNLAIVLWEEDVDEAIILYDQDRQRYYDYFIQKVNKRDKKTFEFLKIKADLYRETPSLSEEEIDTKAKVIYKEQEERKKHVGNIGSNTNSN